MPCEWYASIDFNVTEFAYAIQVPWVSASGASFTAPSPAHQGWRRHAIRSGAVPGGVTAIDGHQMAKKGRAGDALATTVLGSFFAGTVATGRFPH